MAVFKALGVTTGRLLAGLVVQGCLVSLLAAVIAVGIALVLAPAFPVQVALTVGDAVRLVGVAVLVGLVTSAFSVRGPVRVDPVQAFAAG